VQEVPGVEACLLALLDGSGKAGCQQQRSESDSEEEAKREEFSACPRAAIRSPMAREAVGKAVGGDILWRLRSERRLGRGRNMCQRAAPIRFEDFDFPKFKTNSNLKIQNKNFLN
jgi:hypothetical protein